MDDDLTNLSRDDLIAEVIRLRNGIRAHATAAAMNSAGITRSYGGCCPN